MAKAINSRERRQTPLGHAELLALHRASQKRQNWRLEDCTLYVTLEPCVMCAGAIQQSRIGRVVYGAKDLKGGGVESLFNILSDSRLNHQVQDIQNLNLTDCAALLSQFFLQKRKRKKSLREFRTRGTAIIIHEDHILGFYAQDPTSQKEYFFLPGGKVEKHEQPLSCTERECLEETGHKVFLDETSAFTKDYNFHWNGQDYACRTHFYLGSLDESYAPHDVKDASYHQGVGWIHIKEAAQIFQYSPAIQGAVLKAIKNYKKKTVLR